jgi:hypothetical protein
VDRVRRLLEESIGLYKEDDNDKDDEDDDDDVKNGIMGGGGHDEGDLSSESSDDDEDMMVNTLSGSEKKAAATMTLKTFNFPGGGIGIHQPGDTEDLFSELVRTRTPNFGETPLHLASYKSHTEVCLCVTYVLLVRCACVFFSNTSQ